VLLSGVPDAGIIVKVYGEEPLIGLKRISDPLGGQPYRESGAPESRVMLRLREVPGDASEQVIGDGYTV
jgi:hypothetical protein